MQQIKLNKGEITIDERENTIWINNYSKKDIIIWSSGKITIAIDEKELLKEKFGLWLSFIRKEVQKINHI